jgi:putative component of toxin-antitoxin plasmid stabilization module
LWYHHFLIEIRQYVDRQGRTPFLIWLNALSDESQARAATALNRLERGNLSSIKSVGAGVQELRIYFGPDTAFTSAGMEKSLSSCSPAAVRSANKLTSNEPRSFGWSSRSASGREHGANHEL